MARPRGHEGSGGLGGVGAEASIPALIFDTDVLVALFRDTPGATDFFRSVAFDERAVSVFGLMELLQGCRTRREVNTVERFVDRNVARVIPGSASIAETALSLLRRHAHTDGLRMGDALIAATALAMGGRLATGNVKHFRTLKGLKILPFAPTGSSR